MNRMEFFLGGRGKEKVCEDKLGKRTEGKHNKVTSTTPGEGLLLWG